MYQRTKFNCLNYVTLKRIHAVYLCDLGLGNVFLDMTSKTQVPKQKINWVLSKLKTLCMKGYYKKAKR